MVDVAQSEVWNVPHLGAGMATYKQNVQPPWQIITRMAQRLRQVHMRAMIEDAIDMRYNTWQTQAYLCHSWTGTELTLSMGEEKHRLQVDISPLRRGGLWNAQRELRPRLVMDTRTSPCRILQKLGVNVLCGELDVPDDRAPDKAVLDGHLRAHLSHACWTRQGVPHTMCGCLPSSSTLILSSRMFRNLEQRHVAGRALSERNGADVLVHRLQGPGDGEVILELDGDRLVGESLEHGEDKL